jgi:Apea-like HEPN
MTAIVTSVDSTVATIVGHGIRIQEAYELAPGIILRPSTPSHSVQVVADGCNSLVEYAAVLSMQEYASFSMEIQEERGGKYLATKTWNSLWLFHLLALACQSPCDSLYTWSGNAKVNFALSTPHVTFQRTGPLVSATVPQLEWARSHLERFELIQEDKTFTASLMCYGNSHHLFGYAPRIMLLWSGIERLFKVSSELTRTLALYSALMLEENSAEARYDCYKRIKKDYDLRSKVVHGALEKETQMEDAYIRASGLLVKLLAKCVDLSRVPTSEELDRAALTGYIR